MSCIPSEIDVVDLQVINMAKMAYIYRWVRLHQTAKETGRIKGGEQFSNVISYGSILIILGPVNLVANTSIFKCYLQPNHCIKNSALPPAQNTRAL